MRKTVNWKFIGFKKDKSVFIYIFHKLMKMMKTNQKKESNICQNKNIYKKGKILMKKEFGIWLRKSKAELIIFSSKVIKVEICDLIKSYEQQKSIIVQKLNFLTS